MVYSVVSDTMCSSKYLKVIFEMRYSLSWGRFSLSSNFFAPGRIRAIPRIYLLQSREGVDHVWMVSSFLSFYASCPPNCFSFKIRPDNSLSFRVSYYLQSDKLFYKPLSLFLKIYVSAFRVFSMLFLEFYEAYNRSFN